MNKQRLKKPSWVTASIFGEVTCILLNLIFLLIGTSLVKNESIAPQSGYYIIILGQAISVFLSCIFAGKTAGEKSGLSAMVSGGIYYLLLIAVSIMFFDGVGDRFLLGTITIVVGAGAGIYLVIKGSVPKTKKKSVRRFR